VAVAVLLQAHQTGALAALVVVLPIQLLQVVRQLLDKVSQAVVTQAILIQAVVVVVLVRLVKMRRQILLLQQVVLVFPLIRRGGLQQERDKMFRALFIMAAVVLVVSTLAQVEQELLFALLAVAVCQAVSVQIPQD
jgi:hypothetical protein